MYRVGEGRVADSGFRVRFWGVRGSIAAPGPATARYGGNTPCIEVRCGPHLLIFDAGTGIRALGEKIRAEEPLDADLFLTHTHYDHISGLPFFGPAYKGCNRFTLWEGHLGAGKPLEDVLRQLMAAPLFPVPLNIIESNLRFRKFAAGDRLEPRPGVTIHTAPLHHPNEATAYRVEYGGKALCLAFDTEPRGAEPDPGVVAIAKGADLLVHDAMFTDAEYATHKGWGHSSWEEAVRVADAAGVGRLVLFHHDPGRADDALDVIGHAALARRKGTIVAAEGMVIGL